MPTLYIVGTPIGNLEDITLRALRVLHEVGLVAAEDTRRARLLLQRHGISTPLASYHEQGRGDRAAALASQLAEKDIALITEAGMPSISDPGYALVGAALERGFPVEVVPGPSAITAALALSGLPADQFVFLGFLPRTATQRRRLLTSLAAQPRTLVAFEAPHRLCASLEDILATLGDRRIGVCRELTKLHEEVFRGTVRGAMERFRQPRGEFTLVIAGATEAPAMADDAVLADLERLRAEGMPPSRAVARTAAAAGRPRREVYLLWLQLAREQAGGSAEGRRRGDGGGRRDRRSARTR